jgi:hypothetical protein
MRSTASRAACVTLIAAAWCAAPAAAQTPASGELAKQLVSTLSTRGLDAIAARDPQKPDQAIAALAFPGSQILVVAAPYPEANGLDALLAHGMYRDVYSVLQQPSITNGKLFIQDLGGDGLQANGFDIVYENGKTQTLLDGNWKKQGLKESEYHQRATAAETRYARMLSALIAAAQKPKG